MGQRERMCIASRTRQPESVLLRMVIDPRDAGRVIADPQRHLPGRGAWITPDLAALEKAEKRRAIARALRAPHDVDTSHVYDFVAAHYASAQSSTKGKTTH